jgi:hypothetical protein
MPAPGEPGAAARRAPAYDARGMRGVIKQRVKIGTCSGPAEAAFVRSVFDAHDLPVVINGEMHASAMGGLAGFVGLEIFVDAADAEDAIALLHDIRAGEHAVSEHDDLPGSGDGPQEREERDERDDAAGVWDARQDAAVATGAAAASRAAAKGFDTRRRSVGAVLLLSVVLGFGTAHMSTGAWGRGLALASLNAVGIALVVGGDPLGGWLLFGGRFVDLFGALLRVWLQPPGQRTRA